MPVSSNDTLLASLRRCFDWEIVQAIPHEHLNDFRRFAAAITPFVDG